MTIAIWGAIIGVYGWLIRLALRKNGDYVHMSEFEEHKKNVRYTDTCNKVHEGLMKLVDERHQETRADLKEIKDLIRNNGKKP